MNDTDLITVTISRGQLKILARKCHKEARFKKSAHRAAGRLGRSDNTFFEDYIMYEALSEYFKEKSNA